MDWEEKFIRQFLWKFLDEHTNKFWLYYQVRQFIRDEIQTQNSDIEARIDQALRMKSMENPNL